MLAKMFFPAEDIVKPSLKNETDNIFNELVRLQQEIKDRSLAMATPTHLPEQHLAYLTDLSLSLQKASKQAEFTKARELVTSLQQWLNDLFQTATHSFNTDLNYLFDPANRVVEQTPDFNKYCWYLARSHELTEYFTEAGNDKSKIACLENAKENLLENIAQWCEQTLTVEKRMLQEVEEVIKTLLNASILDFNIIRQLNDKGSQLAERSHYLKKLALDLTNICNLSRRARIGLSLERITDLIEKIQQLMKAIHAKKMGYADQSAHERLEKYQNDQVQGIFQQLKAPPSRFGLFTRFIQAR